MPETFSDATLPIYPGLGLAVRNTLPYDLVAMQVLPKNTSSCGQEEDGIQLQVSLQSIRSASLATAAHHYSLMRITAKTQKKCINACRICCMLH